MKILQHLTLVTIALILFACGGGQQPGREDKDSTGKHEADTGYTGIKNYYSGEYKIKESEFKNGMKSGITRIYYKGGVVKNEIIYENDIKNGNAKWYYPDGKLFRVTPYANDTINGTQIQYYKSGKVKARIDYVEGKRVPVLSEYDMNGIKITGYPELTYKATDEYTSRGVYKIFVEMSDLSENVKYYRGDYINGLVDLSACTPLLQNATTGYLDLKKGSVNNTDSVTVIAAYLTTYGNRLYYRISIPLPYKDLN